MFYKPTSIDRFINRFRKTGIWIFTSIVLVSTIYTFYSLTPSKPKERKSEKPPMKKQDSSEKLEDLQHEFHHLHDGETGVKLREDPYKSIAPKVFYDHIVDSWDKHELYSYLHDERIFPDVDCDLDQIRLLVREIYDKNNQHLT